MFHLEGKIINSRFLITNPVSMLSRRSSRRITKEDYLVDRGKEETVNSSLARGNGSLSSDKGHRNREEVHPVPSEGGAGAYAATGVISPCTIRCTISAGQIFSRSGYSSV